MCFRHQIVLCVLVLIRSASFPQVLCGDELNGTAEHRAKIVARAHEILKTSCYSCHGLESQESGLRLDSRRRALEGGDGGQVIVPGEAGLSRLLEIVSGTDDEVGLMPPEGEGTPLRAEQIQVLKDWIAHGAPWPQDTSSGAGESRHWSFQPILRPALPNVSDPSWVRNSIDHFVLSRLDAERIAPSAEADRPTLIRRLHLDLLGLPPTPEEVQEFVADPRPDAYERLVQRMFASPHFGERWGRHWLDLARYADSDGYEKDRARPHAWRYRNWVVAALNADLPFDRFSIEQLAGDMLKEPTTEQLVASGFHRNTLHNTEGGTDPEEDRVKKTVDRTNTMGTIWLGLTLGCCQCHSHKYDPLTQREYFSMFAFFNSMDESDIDAPTAPEKQQYQLARRQFDAEQAKLLEARQAYEETGLKRALREWRPTALQDAVIWQPLEIRSATSRHGAAFEKQEDASLLVTGPNQSADSYQIQAAARQTRLTGIRLELLPDERLPKKGPGRAEHGNFVLTSFRLHARLPDGTLRPIKLHPVAADFMQKGWPLAAAINDDPADGWAVSPQVGQRHVAVFGFQQPWQIAGDTTLLIEMDQQHPQPHNMGRFRLSATSAAAPLTLEGMPLDVEAALQTDNTERTADQRRAIADYHKSVDPEFLRLQQRVDEHQRRAPKPPATKAQTVVQIEQPRETRVHIRGDFLNPGRAVVSAAPQVLHRLTPRSDSADRLDLAHWLFARSNPLTARVTVNRVWQRFFERGIVNTVDDFGSQGDPPSHPLLLDWLASEFRDSGWSLKRIQRLMVLSATYRQSSAQRPELSDLDPENRLLARQVRHRVEAEVIRDLSLHVSGLFDARIGGPSVRPAQPTEYAALTYANSARWQVSPGGDRYRRGLYTFFQRTSPYPMLVTFDSPDANACCAERSLSNTPLQALTLWNDPVFFECAQEFGRRVLRETSQLKGPAATAARAKYAIQLALSRQPNEYELAEVIALHDAQLELGQRDPQMAGAIVGEHPGPAAFSQAELASWIVVGRTIMNLDEFITKE